MTQLEDQVCSCCGRKFDICDANQEFRIHHAVNYGSKYDGDIIDFQLCCDCLDKAIDSMNRIFVVPPKVGEYL